MYCTKCRHTLPEGAKFCTVCGAPAADLSQADEQEYGIFAEKTNSRPDHKRRIALAMMAYLYVLIFIPVYKITEITETASSTKKSFSLYSLFCIIYDEIPGNKYYERGQSYRALLVVSCAVFLLYIIALIFIILTFTDMAARKNKIDNYSLIQWDRLTISSVLLTVSTAAVGAIYPFVKDALTYRIFRMRSIPNQYHIRISFVYFISLAFALYIPRYIISCRKKYLSEFIDYKNNIFKVLAVSILFAGISAIIVLYFLNLTFDHI